LFNALLFSSYCSLHRATHYLTTHYFITHYL
jgi:hypothetical protein